MNKKMILIGGLVALLGMVIPYLFYPEYPCVGSGIGCKNWFHMMSDTWSWYVGLLLFFSGMASIVEGVRIKKSTKKER